MCVYQERGNISAEDYLGFITYVFRNIKYSLKYTKHETPCPVIIHPKSK